MMLAIDPATITGWARCEPGGEIEFGHKRMGPARCGLGEAALAMHEWLPEHLGWRITNVIYERPYIPQPRQFRLGKIIAEADRAPPMNADTVFRLATFAGLIEMAAFVADIPVLLVTSGQAAKHFTGRGSWGSRLAKKAATIDIARRYGFDVKSDDEADAIALLLYGESVLYPEAAMRRRAGPLFTR